MRDEELIKETTMLDYSQLVMHNVYMIKENERLHSIIKEVRKYIEHKASIRECYMINGKEYKELLEILGRENKEK